MHHEEIKCGISKLFIMCVLFLLTLPPALSAYTKIISAYNLRRLLNSLERLNLPHDRKY